MISLPLLGLLTVIALLVLIVGRWMSPLVALIAVPVVSALVGGFGLQTGGFIVSGLQQIAPVATMFVFAILYFGIITDAGTLDPVIDGVLRAVGAKPTRVVVGTALLALLIHLDGSGAVTFLITVPAVLPLYDHLRIDRRVLACTVSLAAGVNFLPWTGPMVRASAALHIPVSDLFRPLIPVQLVGLLFVFGVAWWFGRRVERQWVSSGMTAPQGGLATGRVMSDEQIRLRRPGRLKLNAAVTLIILSVMVWGIVDPGVMFMIGTAVVLMINYPEPTAQRERIESHARAALMMAAILLAAGAFTGIMKGTGMLSAMAGQAVGFVPESMARHIPFGLAMISMPLSLLFDPDSFYLGVLPVIANVAGTFGVPATQVGQAALLGQMTTGFPVSPLTPATFLVVGLTGIELGEHQRFAGPWLFAATVVMTIAAVLFGVFPL